MSKIVQINGRSGFYLRIPVPSDVRKAVGSNTIQRKAGVTRAEAMRNRPGLLAKAEELFAQKRGNDPVGDAFREAEENPHQTLVELLEERLKAIGLTSDQILSVLYDKKELERQGLNTAPVDPKYKTAIKSRLAGGTPYTEWITKRLIEEKPAASTEARWKGSMDALSKWFGSSYLGEMTKVEAGDYKRFLLSKNKESTTKTNITCIKAFWAWALVNGYVKENIWLGQTKKLSTTTCNKPVQKDLLDQAMQKAIELKDIGFYIQLYTGCRKGEHQGLRWSDLDLDNNWVHFKRYQHGEIIRELKGKEEDVRSVPINTKLRAKILELLAEAATNNKEEPIWPDQYYGKLQYFGNKWAKRFVSNYGFKSHDLRSHAVTTLIANNISPFILKEITRHSVGAMSDVVAGYVRPTEEQLREVMELLA